MKRYIIILQAMALVLTACTERMETEKSAEDQDIYENALTEVSAEIAGMEFADGTKTSVSSSGSYTWQIGDRAGFFPDASNVRFGNPEQAVFHVTSVSGNIGVFGANGWGVLRSKRYYTYYPYDEAATSSSVSVRYTGQNQGANNSSAHLGTVDYLHAYVDVPASGNQTIQYKHVGCQANFTVTVPSEYSSATFTDMTISLGTSMLVSSAKYNPSSQSVSLTDKSMSSTMTINFNGGSGFKCNGSNQLLVYAMMSPVQWSGKPVTVTLHDSMNHEYGGTFTPGKNQEAGKIYTYSAAVECKGSAKDLSLGESANSYIVTSAGDYKFRAVKGNSSTAVSGIAGAKTLWESNGTYVATAVGDIIGNVYYEGGYVYFSTNATFTKGNAVIAAYGNSGCTGDVLWSWHIWCTDEPEDQEYKFGAGYLMDRNLGALSVTGNLSGGLFYQWGRKDPFVGTASLMSNNPCSLAGTGISIASTSSSVGTIAYATAHPTVFITDNNTQGDWRYTRDGTMWYGGEDVKTLYDPCPPGYRVPDGSSSKETSGRGFWGKALHLNYKTTATGNVFTTDAGTLTFADNMLSFPLEGGSYAYYPACGCINEGGNRLYAGDHIFSWPNYPGGADDNGWHDYYSGNLDVNMASSMSLSVNWNSGRAAGKTVRCMRMQVDRPASQEDNEGFGNGIQSSW